MVVVSVSAKEEVGSLSSTIKKGNGHLKSHEPLQTHSPMLANWESRPKSRSMKKNKKDHRGETGNLERASG